MRINRRQIIVYPFLFAIYPLLNLYVTNIHLLEVWAVVKPLLLILGVTLVFYLMVNRLLRASTSVGILTAATAVAVLYYGAFYDVVGTAGVVGATVQRHEYLLPVWIVLFVLVGTLVVRKRIESAQANEYLNFLSIAIIGAALVPGILSVVRGTTTRDSSLEPTVNSPVPDNPTRGRSLNARIELDALPDVYYIILDGYGRQDVLLDHYDFDNSAFIDYLTSKGFYVASESLSNYARTYLSLPSSLNLSYLDFSGVEGLRLGKAIGVMLSFIENNYVIREFNSRGYTTIHFASGWEATDNSDLADINLRFSTMNQLNSFFLNTTILRPVAPDYSAIGKRAIVLGIFDKLKEIPEIKDPTYTFAHVSVPHAPFIFDREGNLPDGEFIRNTWMPKESYSDQVFFVNRLVEEAVDSILAQSGVPPIIIIQADHGPMPNNWMRARTRLPILNAYYLPAGGEEYLYSTITPVNSFRLIFDLYFGADFGLIEDKSFFEYIAYSHNLCEFDDIYPGNGDQDLWAARTTELLVESAYRLYIKDCHSEQVFMTNEGFHAIGENATWAGPSLKLQFPVKANQEYIFRAKVRHMLPDKSQEVRLLIDDELVDSTTISSRGDHEITFIVSAKQIHTEEPFVRVRIEHSYSMIGYGGSPRELSLAYYWIEWAPLSEARVRVSQAGPENCPLVTVDPLLKGTIGIDPQLQTPPWPIEVYDDGSLLWLGDGDQRGIEGTLWSAEKQIVYLTFDVAPGPAREDSLRTVELTVENEAGIKTERQQFNQPTTLTFAVALQPGRNEFSFKSLDKATILTQPNGDTRPLLVRLRHITVVSLLDRSQAGPENYPLVTVDPSLAEAVGIDPHLKTPWPIEVYEEHSLSFLWLGHGEAEGVAGTLWSDVARPVVLAFEVSPGPSREDQQRTVQLVLQSNNQVAAHKETFEELVVLAFPVQLQVGRNDFRFTVLDEATTPVHGDTRPLLVSLHHITVKPLPGP